MPPNLRRYLPFILGAFVLLILVPSLFRKNTSAASTATSQSTQTFGTLDHVDRSEQQFQAAHGRYTAQVADLLSQSHALATDLADGLVIQLDISSDGHTYYALVESPVLSLLRARDNGKLIAERCVIVKSESGVSCPAPKVKAKAN